MSQAIPTSVLASTPLEAIPHSGALTVTSSAVVTPIPASSVAPPPGFQAAAAGITSPSFSDLSFDRLSLASGYPLPTFWLRI